MTTTQTQLRRDTAANIAAATPAAGEPFYDTTNKRLGVGDGVNAGGIPHVSAVDLQKQSFVYATVGGTANAISLTNSPAVAAYTNGLRLIFKATGTNTGATTVNVDGLGAKNIYKMQGGSLTALASGDIVSGGIYEIVYDGTQFQFVSAASAVTSVAAGDGLSGGTITSTGTISINTNNSMGIGSYALLRYNFGTPLANGATTASNLVDQNGGTPAGTWRNVSGFSVSSATAFLTLWIRVA